MASADPADWRLCDPGDGSAAYYFNVETGDTLWDPPEGVDASQIREFGFEDEQVLDELGIEEAPQAAEQPEAAADVDQESHADAGDPAPGVALIRTSQAASDSTESLTPPPLPDAPGAAGDAAAGADPGRLPTPVSFDAPSDSQSRGPAGLVAPAAEKPDEEARPDAAGQRPAAAAAAGEQAAAQDPGTGAAAQEERAAPRKPAPTVRASASMPGWGLSGDGASGFAGDHLGFSSVAASGRCFARVAAALGVWGRSGGTHSSIVGTLGHPIQGGRISAAGQWVTRRGESRGLTHGEVYWVNRVTGETKWERPEDADKPELSDAALAHSDVSDTDPLLGCRPRAAEAEVLGDPDSRLERVWGGGTDHSDAASLLMRAGLMPEALAAAWSAAEEEAGDAAASAEDVARELNALSAAAAQHGAAAIADAATTTDGPLAAGEEVPAQRPAAPAAAFKTRPPWPTLPSIPTVVPAAPGDGGPLGAGQAVWRLVPALPSVATLAAEQYADAQAAGGESGAAETSSAADALDDDVIGSLLVAASGPSLATGLYRRLSAMLVLMQSQGSDEEWAELLRLHNSILPRFLVSCLGPTLPPAVSRAAAQCLFLAAQLDDDVPRMLITPFSRAAAPACGAVRRPGADGEAAGSPRGPDGTAPGSSAASIAGASERMPSSEQPLWRCWAGLSDTISVCIAGIVASLHGWRLRWPRSPEGAATAAAAAAAAAAGGGGGEVSGAGAGEAAGFASGTAPPAETIAVARARSDTVDEESLFSFCLLLELALGATVMEPVQLSELGYPDAPAGAGQADAGEGGAPAEAVATGTLACLRDPELRYAASACLASALSAAPRGQTTAAVTAALSSLTLACEEAVFADPAATAQAGVAAGLAPDAQGRIPGLSDVLCDHPSLVAGMAAGLLNVLVGVGEHHAEVSAGANPDQLTAATSLIRRLLQPGALPASVVSLFYTTDLHVLIDICLREVVDLPETDPLRAEYVLTLQELLLLSQWHKEGSYRADDVVTVVSDLITSGAADAVPAVRDAAESLLLECRDLLDD